MKRGSLPRWTVRVLGEEPAGLDFAPDGLDQVAIDALIGETCGFDFPQVEADSGELGGDADIRVLPVREADSSAGEEAA